MSPLKETSLSWSQRDSMGGGGDRLRAQAYGALLSAAVVAAAAIDAVVAAALPFPLGSRLHVL